MTAASPMGPIDLAGGTALIVDDHPLFCEALALTLQAVAGLRQVGAVHSLSGALAALSEAPAPPALVVLDLDLPDVDGLGGLLTLRRTTEAPILIVSSMTGTRMVAAAIAAGASGFVPKNAGRDVFRAALSALGEGRRYLPDGYLEAGTDAGPAVQDVVARLAELTPQQARILDLICQGMLNKQIAYDLSIAETTVKAHVTAIMRKLGVQSRTQAVLTAQQARFASLMPEG
ncbi:MAG: LuxR C-terminal-related transcriptional regulator [Gemmobacter sp.]